MSHHHLREEKNCLNCGHTVEERYCGNCGQENIQPRQTFIHLVAHFFEDITHYEGKFWASLRLLFFKPAFLSKAFLEGKRNSYFAPVRLYIFASFITFFLPGLIPSPPEQDHKSPYTVTTDGGDTLQIPTITPKDILGDTASAKQVERKFDGNLGYTSEFGIRIPTKFKDLREVDSAKFARKDSDDPMHWMEYTYEKKAVELLNNKYPPEDQLRIFIETLAHNFPKALFLYMPLFAFVLRLFHKRKNWMYFDHAIFTLHYFSFMLLTFLLINILSEAVGWIACVVPPIYNNTDIIQVVIFVLGILSYPFYLYKAHSRMYGESAGVSFLKTSGILFLNFFLFIALFISLMVYTLFTMH